jgi:hypothetical protein
MYCTLASRSATGPPTVPPFEELPNVPIDQKLNVPATGSATVPPPEPAIENEIAAYRALSPGAIVALVCGVLSILSFASYDFLAFSVAAIVLGVLADRKIQRLPEILTGRGLAQAGVGLGLMFGLTALTVTTVQDFMRARQAKTFAHTVENLLKEGTYDQLLWYSQPAVVRAKNTPEKLLKDMSKDAQSAMSLGERYGALKMLNDNLKAPENEVHFKGLEGHGEDGLDSFAAALYEVHFPKAEKPEDKERYALAVIKGVKSKTGALEWYIESVQYPYKPKSLSGPAPKAVDDGHGHAH